MMTPRNAILNGAQRAAELHTELGLRRDLKAGERPVDVIEVIHKVGLLLLFRPLSSLLGAYLPNGSGGGILVTTQRDLHVQRFTAAHELGHHVLQHTAPSLDSDVGYVARGEANGYDLQELEADSFAAEFLLPAWLIVAHAKRRQWGKSDLRNSDTVYQLSLRLGASYSATCWALFSNKFIDLATARTLARTPPKECKQRALPGYSPPTWSRRDVWLLSKHDQGAEILGNPDDLLVLSLDEHVNAGYVWDMTPLTSAGFHIADDKRIEANPTTIGGCVTRRVVAQGAVDQHISLMEQRPWMASGDLHSIFEIDVAMVGHEVEGLPRTARSAMK